MIEMWISECSCDLTTELFASEKQYISSISQIDKLLLWYSIKLQINYYKLYEIVN